MTMQIRGACWLALGLLALPACMLASRAQAQTGSTPAPRAHVPTEEDRPSVPPPVPTLPPSRGIAGLRLDPGAVLCRTEADLRHRADVTRRISDGEPDAGEPLLNCRVIAQARGVDVVERAGLGRAEVKLKPSGELGWTDAYLP